MGLTLDYTIDELISVCIARQVEDGEVLAQGLNTPLVMVGYMLAQQTHAPNVRFASAIGQSIGHRFSPLGVTNIEAAWLQNGLIHPGFLTAALDLLPKFSPKEFFRPAQIDAAGFTNNISLPRPRLRLPGTGGIPDVTVYSERIYFYVPRHSPAVFVEEVEIRSGMGVSSERKRGASPRYLVSDLGQLDWANGRMRVTHLHLGVSVEQIQRKTSFQLEVADPILTTLPPSNEELRLLREVIDPLGVRKLETLAGATRKDLLRQIIRSESSR